MKNWIDDLSSGQEESYSVPEEHLNLSSVTTDEDVPNTTLRHQTPREDVVLNILEKLLETRSNSERNEGCKLARCIVDLVHANERCGDKLQLTRQECEGWKASAQAKATEHNTTTRVKERTDLDVDNNQDILSFITALKEEHDEIKSSTAKLQESMALVLHELGEIKLSLENVRRVDQNNEVQNLLPTPNEQISNLQGAQHSQDSRDKTARPSQFWCKSKTTMASHHGDVLSCQPLFAGQCCKYRFKVRFNIGRNIYLGVVSTLREFNFDKFLANEPGAYVYGSNGRAYHATHIVRYNLPKYSSGSKLTFKLDLTLDGSLSVYIDDDETHPIALFNDMLSSVHGSSTISVHDSSTIGFVPAVYCDGIDENGVEYLGGWCIL